MYFRKRCDIINFPGTYSEYLDRYGHDIIEEEQDEKSEAEKPASKGKMDFKEQKKLRNRINKLKKEIEEIQKEISRLEKEQSSGTSRDNKLAGLMEEWAEKTEELEELNT